MRRFLLIAYALIATPAAALLGGCGDGDSGAKASTSTTSAVLPALASRPAGPEEIVVRGENSPAMHGPYTFDGPYLVRFEQYAPEDPALDFSGQTPLTVSLQRRAGDPRGAIAVFESARRSGRRELEIRGRYFVDVSFGDFPYVVRFTPRS
jgi:hypothetical protein